MKVSPKLQKYAAKYFRFYCWVGRCGKGMRVCLKASGGHVTGIGTAAATLRPGRQGFIAKHPRSAHGRGAYFRPWATGAGDAVCG